MAEGARHDLPQVGRAAATAIPKIARAIVGSARAAIVMARLEPIPPKAEAVSSPARARKKVAEEKQVHHDHEIADTVERQGSGDEGHQETGDERRGEQDAGGGVEDPGRLRRDDPLLVQKLREIAVRLEDPRPAPSLHARLEQADDPMSPGESARVRNPCSPSSR